MRLNPLSNGRWLGGPLNGILLLESAKPAIPSLNRYLHPHSGGKTQAAFCQAITSGG